MKEKVTKTAALFLAIVFVLVCKRICGGDFLKAPRPL